MHSKEFHPFTIIPYDHSYNSLKQNQKEKLKSDSKYMLAVTLPLASPMSWLSMLEYHEVSR